CRYVEGADRQSTRPRYLCRGRKRSHEAGGLWLNSSCTELDEQVQCTTTAGDQPPAVARRVAWQNNNRCFHWRRRIEDSAVGIVRVRSHQGSSVGVSPDRRGSLSNVQHIG